MTGADPLARLAAGAPDRRAPGRLGRWPGLLVGIAMLAAVVAVATHISEPREFARLVEHAEPWWIAVAIVLQAGTYVALAQVWRAVVRAARHALSLGVSTRIALAKLFVDNALPSGGISGSVLVASALEKRGLPVPVVTATIVIELASYYLAYAISLAVAVAVAAAQGHAGRVVVVPSLAFVAISIGIAFGAIALSRTARSLPRWFGLRRAGRWLAGADRQLTGDLRLLVRTTAWQLVIVAFDGATLWTLIRALGVHAPAAGVFTSFMIASLARTLSILPGGLGVFEGVAVLTLHQIGAPVPAALSATLLFRGLSYWLPMIPGFIVSRRLR